MPIKPRSPGDQRASAEDEQAGSRIGTTVLGSFYLLRELGRGSYATAYLAQQVGTERHAVVKIPHPHLLESDSNQRIRSRFAAELRASTRVHHPNIATVYTAGDTEDGVPAIAMEHVPGRMLRALLETEAPLPPSSIGILGCQIASALGALHAAGIVHRDVTPRNILASADAEGRERYVLLDFGIAELGDLPGQPLGAVGTPRYMPREQVYGRAGPQSDMFALGAILWWALTGKEYLTDIDSMQSVLQRQIEQTAAPDPRDIQPSLPDPIAHMVSRLLHPDPRIRPAARVFAGEWPALVDDWSRSSSQQDPHHPAAARPGAPERARTGVGTADVTVDIAADVNTTALLSNQSWPNAAAEAPHISGQRAGSGSGPGMGITLERFVGIMPEWLQDLHEAVARGDREAVIWICNRIGDSTRLMGADHLARLTDIVARLADDGMLDQVAGFVTEIEEEFHKAFRELLHIHQIY